MRTFGTFLTVGILALTAGCGGSSSSSLDGGGGIGGNSGAGGGGGGSTGACNMPSCLNVSQSCIPSGTCIEQADATTGATNLCYSNGVKIISTVDASLNLTSTVKNATTTCWSMTGSLTSFLGGGALTLKNASGATVGTLTSDQTTGATSVTCTGASAPVVLSDACNAGASASASCTTGACAP
jgi:hypothetical protein